MSKKIMPPRHTHSAGSGAQNREKTCRLRGARWRRGHPAPRRPPCPPWTRGKAETPRQPRSHGEAGPKASTGLMLNHPPIISRRGLPAPHTARERSLVGSARAGRGSGVSVLPGQEAFSPHHPPPRHLALWLFPDPGAQFGLPQKTYRFFRVQQPCSSSKEKGNIYTLTLKMGRKL